MNKTLIIKGSSRKEGNTQKVIHRLNENDDFEVIDLLDYNIGPFDYDFNNRSDDYLPLMENILEKYANLLFVTPVYWYTMSGTMKIFLDRFTDLLHHRKDLGSKLQHKSMAMMSNSNDNDRIPGFEAPFRESAKYLGMHYLGDIHVWFENDNLHPEALKLMDVFKQKLISP